MEAHLLGPVLSHPTVLVEAIPIPRGRDFLRESLVHPVVSDGIPIVPVEALVTMKLIAHRFRDRTDVVEILKAGQSDPEHIRSYLERNAPDLVVRFEPLALEVLAEAEMERDD